MSAFTDKISTAVVGEGRRLPAKRGMAANLFAAAHFMSKTLFFCAGDLSGDIHSARLACEVLRRHPDWKIYALGGAHLREAGAKIVGDTSTLGVIGYVSALAVTPRSLSLKKAALRFLKSQRVDGIVMCDWGGFNTRFLPHIKNLKIPTLYYFPPRSWQQSGEGGLAIAPLVEAIATPFEWSAKRLQAAGGNAQWVGHPLLEIVAESKVQHPREKIRKELGVAADEFLVALFPGSRPAELKIIAPHVAGAVGVLRARFGAKVRFVVAVPRGAAVAVKSHFPDVAIWENRASQILSSCDAAIVKSGTATLEAAVCDAPQVVVYDVSRLVEAQVRLTGLRKKVPFVAMPNIILQRGVVPELLGKNCRAQFIAEAMSTLIESPVARAAMRAEYSLVRAALGATLPYTATSRTADILDEMVPPANPKNS